MNSFNFLPLIIAFLTFFSSQGYGISQTTKHTKTRLQKIFTNSALCIAGACGVITFNPILSKASDIQLSGTVQIVEGTTVPTGNDVALYLTVREDVGTWQSAVRSQKPPPLLSKKIVKPSFPVDVTLTENDLTPEGLQLQSQFTKSKGSTKLFISARLDEDGQAVTRGPNDLVGRGYSDGSLSEGSETKKWSPFSIDLTDRGIGGKFVTQQIKK